MKKQTVSLLLILLSVSSFLFSCHDRVNKRTGDLHFDSILVNKTMHLFGDTAKPACNIVINFAYPVRSSDTVLKDTLLSYFITSCFGEGYAPGSGAEEVVKRYVETYVNDYLHDLEPMYLEDAKTQDKETEHSIGGWYSYYQAIESRLQLYEKDLLVYRVDYNEYTGGAHGIYMSTFLNMDLTQMRPLRLDDLFVGEYKEPLTELIWKQLMTDNHASTREELEELGYASTGDIAPTENFYLNKEGITFYYNVYDITPYAMGAVSVTIPFAALEHLLSSSSILESVRR